MKIALLIALVAPPISSWWELSPFEVRKQINQRIMAIQAPTPAVGSVAQRVVSNGHRETPIRIYVPDNPRHLPIILFIHGGAWVAGNLDTHDHLARHLCSEVRALVVSVGYLNAPEGKFPFSLEQCYDALLWVQKHALEFSADSSRIAVVGDSAGGNLAAALCLMARDRSGPRIKMQVLINPAVDLRCEGTLARQNDKWDLLRWQAGQYLSTPDDVNHPYVSPLTAKNLHDLPSAVVILAEQDDLRDGGQKYADRLLASGVPTQIYCQRGIGHLAGDGARASPRAKESLDVAVSALRTAFSTLTESPCPSERLPPVLDNQNATTHKGME